MRRDGGIATRQAVPTAAAARARGRRDRPGPSTRAMPKHNSPRRRSNRATALSRRARRTLFALQGFAWAIAEWAKQFTSPDGTLRFADPDARRALECRLTIIAVLAHKHWALLDEIERLAVETLFTLTLGPLGRDVWFNQRRRLAGIGGAPVLLRAHALSRYPKAAESLHLALRTLSANGFNGKLDKDTKTQRQILRTLDKTAATLDAEYRKASDPHRDLTYEDLYHELGEKVDRAMKAAQLAADKPAWARLTVECQNQGNDLATLDGKAYRLQSGAAQFLKELQSAKGKPVLAATLTKNCGRRADRIHHALDSALKSIIDSPGKRGQGYRML